MKKLIALIAVVAIAAIAQTATAALGNSVAVNSSGVLVYPTNSPTLKLTSYGVKLDSGGSLLSYAGTNWSVASTNSAPYTNATSGSLVILTNGTMYLKSNTSWILK